MNTIFVFAYYSYKDPVFQSAVLPYLKIVKDKNLRFILLTWEQKQYILSENEVRDIKRSLLKDNIIWKRTNWHSGKLKLFKKIFDFTKGLILSVFLIFKYKVKKIYSEGFPGGIIGHYLSKLSGKPHIIHTFEPHADYMKDARVWSESSWEYKLLKKLEIPIANHCEHIITATSAYKNILIERKIGTNIHVIPSCINMDDYYCDNEARLQIRSELNIKEDQIVIVYLGKIGGMYMEEELFTFFQHCLNLNPDRIQFLLFTNYPQALIGQKLNEFNIPQNKIHSKYLHKEEVSKFLSAADIGFCGVRPIPNQRFSSPIKNGEYWACGLPTIIPNGVSDDYITVEKEGIGLTFNKIDEISLDNINDLLKISRTKIRGIALRERNINSYINKLNVIFRS